MSDKIKEFVASLSDEQKLALELLLVEHGNVSFARRADFLLELERELAK